MRGLCPDCGQGDLFARGLSFRTDCSVCGADFTQVEETGDGPAVFVIFAAGIFIVPIPVILSVGYGWPSWLSMGIFIPVIALASYWMLKKIRGVMFAKAYQSAARGRGSRR